MNRIPTGARRLKRVAAATAIAVAAALLAYPGAATAQTTGIDCAALGDNPAPVTIEDALATAAACAVEVRVKELTGSSATLYATPQGRLHFVATSAPTQARADGSYADPTLVEKDGVLTQTASSLIALGQSDPSNPLVRVSTPRLDWAGTTPDPGFEGTTARYDELAAGLDLTVDVAPYGVELRFTASDSGAWSAFATGLTVPGVSGWTASVADGAINWKYAYQPGQSSIGTTPFTVRDAAGVVTPVELTLNADRTLTASLPEGVLATAAYPLEAATQMFASSPRISDWGSVTSAEPDLAIYRGEAGLDTPYFEAAGEHGDAIAGTYCDAFADCTAEAAAYWNFRWPFLQSLSSFPSGPSSSHIFPIESAEFSVTAAEGTDCVAPDLDLTEPYTVGATWADRPAVISAAATGSCDQGTAQYDVTSVLASIWEHAEPFGSAAFGMTESAETARFNGGTGRLDVYLDAAGLEYSDTLSTCSPYKSDAPAYADSTPQYGDFLVTGWNPQGIDLGLTWTAKFTDVATGKTVLTTTPREVTFDSSRMYSLDSANALPDGQYHVVYDFGSDTVDLNYTSAPCYFSVDTQSPEMTGIAGPEGAPHVGDKVTLEFTATDPGSTGELQVDCNDEDICGRIWPRTVEVGSVFSFTVTLVEGDNQISLSLTDRAGNSSGFGLRLRATYDRNDFDRDGFQDLVAVRESDGKLLFYPGNGDGIFDDPVVLGTGWNKMDVVMAGDLTSDGNPDLLARDTSTGTMYTYPGNGDGTFGTRIRVGSGWNAMGVFTSGDDFNNVGPVTGNPDLLAVRKSDGTLYFYPGLGDGTFGYPTPISTGWNAVDSMTSVGDSGYDYQNELLVRESDTGNWYQRIDYGSLTFEDRIIMSRPARTYSEITAAGDLDGNGYIDLVAVDARTGELIVNPVSLYSAPMSIRAVIDTGWGSIHLPTSTSDRTYDYNGNGASDLIARNSSGTTYLYPGNGKGGFGPRVSWGADLGNLNLLETAGDFNDDGFADVIGRVASTGSLYLFPGNGKGGYNFAARVRIGTGWNSMSTIVSGQDFNSDGLVDLVAREKSTGYLWLYPGRADGDFGTRVKIGSGWNGMREITSVGDLDHDGHADIIAVRSSDNCMYFYGGKGDGTLKAGVKTSCNWTGYDSVAGVGDFDGDGHADWTARRKSDGALFLYKGNGAGGYSARVQIGSGWNAMNIIA